MITFAQYPYQRLDFEDLSARMGACTEKMRQAATLGEAFLQLVETDYLDRLFISYATLSEAGNTNNSYDDFFQEEEAFFNEVKPRFHLLLQWRNAAVLASPFRNELRELLGDEFFDSAQMQRRTVSDHTLVLMQRENTLSQEYSSVMSQLCAEEDGQRLTMSMLAKLAAGGDHATRRKYALLSERAMQTAAPRLDTLYGELVALRHQIAVRTGFDTYTDYSLCKLGRTSYGRKELDAFASAVETQLVPLVARMMARQEERLGYPMMNYDEEDVMPGRHVKPNREPLAAFRQIFGRLSPETKVFFDELCERSFFDLALREGKTNGAYANPMPLCAMPYIFETYNETEGAVRTFAHECGHGLNTFLHRGEAVGGTCVYSSDVAETHSMSMEFFIWRYLGEVVPQEDVPLYQYAHLKNSLTFIPYGTAVDRFQTEVYDHPDMTPAQRLALWQALEKRFLPWRKYERDGFYSQGRAWQRQIHVMKWPFYYIDYVLAQVCALQFWALDAQDHAKAWDTYLRLMKDSGRYSFVRLISRAGLQSPFEDGALAGICTRAEQYLNAF